MEQNYDLFVMSIRCGYIFLRYEKILLVVENNPLCWMEHDLKMYFDKRKQEIWTTKPE